MSEHEPRNEHVGLPAVRAVDTVEMVAADADDRVKPEADPFAKAVYDELRNRDWIETVRESKRGAREEGKGPVWVARESGIDDDPSNMTNVRMVADRVAIWADQDEGVNFR